MSDAKTEVKDIWSKSIWTEHFAHVTFAKGYLEHSHPCYEVVFYSKADAKEFIKDIAYDVKDGSLVMISEYEFHRVMSDNNDHKCGYVVHFRKTFIDKFLKFFNIEHLLNKIFDRTCKVINLNLRQIEQIEQLFAALLKAYERYALNPQDSILHTALVAALFNLLAAITRMMPADSLPPVMTRTEEIIRRIIVYIDEHYADVLKLEDLALRFCLNKYYLSHIFRTYTGFTLFEYILRKRIVEAQKLLKDTDLSIDVIYPQCGFTNKQYFYKVFKKIVNSSPTAFKKTGHTKRSRQAG